MRTLYAAGILVVLSGCTTAATQAKLDALAGEIVTTKAEIAMLDEADEARRAELEAKLAAYEADLRTTDAGVFDERVDSVLHTVGLSFEHLTPFLVFFFPGLGPVGSVLATIGKRMKKGGPYA